MKEKILFVSTGGTISSQMDSENGYSPVLNANDFSRSLSITSNIQIETWQPCNLLSFALDPSLIIQIVNIIKRRLQEESFSGAVLTQGTATMEETAFLANLIWNIEKPLVFTGAMLNASEKDWDGARNIQNSVLTAISSKARGKGVLVCMAGEIHSARDVCKIHKTSLMPFASLNAGPLGVVANQKDVIFYRTPTKRQVFELEKLQKNVDLIKVHLGSDARNFNASVASGAHGIVIEGFPGGGGITPKLMEAVETVRNEDIVVALAPRSLLGTYQSRAGGGCGPLNIYKCGVIPCGDLSSVKARILLGVLLEKGKTKKSIHEIFNKYAP